MSLRVSELWGKIIPEKSKLQLTGTKLELGLCKKSKVPWKTLEAREEGAQIAFGMPEKIHKIWPAEIHELLPEDVKQAMKPKPKPKVVEAPKEDDDSDLDIDDIKETEWS